MDLQVLVANATLYGTTAEIAEKIGQVLRQAGLRADVLPTDRISDRAPTRRFCWAARFIWANGARSRRLSWRPTRRGWPSGRHGSSLAGLQGTGIQCS